ncbi:hypothetical protein Pmani_023553 [Petrolisthes manimaculis]|uniref:Uncharacterized protein n=1 Tax=Petrolisthes manimaculis TaxID=1843537 RepID=A0AAE1PAV7_9EUCA|nr:hypothetical protein Pmani_023553 [Petrolisthes manimaculis]
MPSPIIDFLKRNWLICIVVNLVSIGLMIAVPQQIMAMDMRAANTLEDNLAQQNFLSRATAEQICGPRPEYQLLSRSSFLEYNTCMANILESGEDHYTVYLTIAIVIAHLVVMAGIALFVVCRSKSEKKNILGVRVSVKDGDDKKSMTPPKTEVPSRWQVFMAKLKRVCLCGCGDLTSIEKAWERDKRITRRHTEHREIRH